MCYITPIRIFTKRYIYSIIRQRQGDKVDTVDVIVVGEDEKLKGLMEEYFRHSETLTLYQDPAGIPWEELGEHRAFIVDVPSLSGDPKEAMKLLEREAVVLLIDGDCRDVAEELAGRYEPQLLLKDAQNTYIQMIPMFVRRALKDKDKENSTMEVMQHIHKRKYDFLNAMPDIVYKLDPKGYFVYLNEAVRTIGYTPQELLGRHFTIIVTEEDRAKASREAVLSKYSGKVTGYEGAPGLFDERRSTERATKGLEIKLRKKARGHEVDESTLGSIIAYGEVSATGQYTKDSRKKTFVGTVGIIRDITTRRKSEKLLHLLSFALEQSPSGICIINADRTVVYINPYFSQKFGVRYDTIDSLDIDEIWEKISGGSVLTDVLRETEEMGYCQRELHLNPTEEQTQWYSVMLYPVVFFDDATHFVLLLDDITEKKISEEQMKKDIEEKDILLKEIHHRVRNNLNVISSLFSLQKDEFPDNEDLADILLAGQNRIDTMARVHEQLYNEERFSSINISTYISTLVPEILSSYGDIKHIELNIDIDEVHFSLTKAIPCGLIVNELVTNAYKHAFPDMQEGKVSVSLRLDGENNCILVVHDDGVGLPENLNPYESNSLGFKLIYGLCEQIDGKIEVTREQGTKAQIVIAGPEIPE